MVQKIIIMSIKTFFLTYNVELYLFFIHFSWSLQYVTVQQLLQDKICVQNYNKSVDDCHDLGIKESSDKSRILTDATNLAVYGTVAEAIPMVILAIAMGPVCNKYLSGRKMFMLAAAGSSLFKDGLFILNSIYFGWLSLFVVLSYIASVFGSTVAGITCAYSYVSIYVPNESRVKRFITIEASVTMGWALGPVGGALLIDSVPLLNIGLNQVYNYVGVLLLCAACDLTAFLWIFFTIHEKEHPKLIRPQLSINSGVNDERTGLTQVTSEGNKPWIIIRVIKDMLNPQNVMDLSKTLSQERPDGNRRRLLLTIFCLVLINVSYKGIDRTQYAFTEEVYDWIPVKYFYFFTIGAMMEPIAMFMAQPILTKLFKMNDYQIAITGCIAGILYGLCIGMVLFDWGMYIGCTFGSLMGMAPSSSRSILSKLVPPEDVTKIFAAQAIMDTMAPPVAAAAFSAIFDYTIDSFPSLIYFLFAICHLIPMIFYVIWDIKYSKREVISRRDDRTPSVVTVTSLPSSESYTTIDESDPKLIHGL